MSLAGIKLYFVGSKSFERGVNINLMLISIIIPTLNEEASISHLLQQLQIYRQQGHEVIVSDGGSIDKTISIAKPLADEVINSESGRAVQMNAGAKQAKHEVLWFLHADTVVYEKSIEKILSALNQNNWGRFNIKLSGSHALFRIIEKMINIRSCLSHIATGDQGFFVKTDLFNSVGRYPMISLMEDVALSKKLRQVSKPACIKKPLITSSRRWEEKGIFSTIILMWRLRFLYWLGVDADKLSSQYK